MQVSVYKGKAFIGTAMLEHLDASMGVAFGPFVPADRYDRRKHANTIDGLDAGDNGKSLSVRVGQNEILENAAIAIQDWDDPEVGQHLTLFFSDSADFKARFSNHSDYRE